MPTKQAVPAPEFIIFRRKEVRQDSTPAVYSFSLWVGDTAGSSRQPMRFYRIGGDTSDYRTGAWATYEMVEAGSVLETPAEPPTELTSEDVSRQAFIEKLRAKGACAEAVSWCEQAPGVNLFDILTQAQKLPARQHHDWIEWLAVRLDEFDLDSAIYDDWASWSREHSYQLRSIAFRQWLASEQGAAALARWMAS